MIFAVQYDFVPEQTERRLAARPAHREWLTALKADSRLVQARQLDVAHHREVERVAQHAERGAAVERIVEHVVQLAALLVFEVEDEGALDALLADDPYPKDSYVVVSRRTWTPLFSFGR